MSDTTHSCVWHDSSLCVTWRTPMCGVTHSDVWHNSFLRVTWLIHMYDMTHFYVWHDSFSCVACLIHMCDMTHPYVWHDTIPCVAWLTHMCDVTYSYVWHDAFSWWRDSFLCTRFWGQMIDLCHMTHSYVLQHRFATHCNTLQHTAHSVFEGERMTFVTWLIPMRNMIYSYVWHDSFVFMICLIPICDT